jgi:hypothetical protein
MFQPRGGCLAYSSTNFLKLLINFFSLFYNIFNTTSTSPSLNYKYPSMCVHKSHRPYGYPPFMLCSWQRVHNNSLCSSWNLCCHCLRCWFLYGVKIITCTSIKHVQLLLLMNQHCAYQRWHSPFSQGCHCWPNTSRFTFLILCHTRICCLWCGSNQRTKLSQLTFYRSIPPLTMEVFGCLHKHVDVFLHKCANAIWSLKGQEGSYLS